MLGEIYLVVLCTVGIVTYFHLVPKICIDEDINVLDDMNDLRVPIYK